MLGSKRLKETLKEEKLVYEQNPELKDMYEKLSFLSKKKLALISKASFPMTPEEKEEIGKIEEEIDSLRKI